MVAQVLYVLQGVGRAVYESTGKGVFADFFPGDAAGAFANNMLQNATAFALCFFLSDHLKAGGSVAHAGNVPGVKGVEGSLSEALSFLSALEAEARSEHREADLAARARGLREFPRVRESSCLGARPRIAPTLSRLHTV